MASSPVLVAPFPNGQTSRACSPSTRTRAKNTKGAKGAVSSRSSVFAATEASSSLASEQGKHKLFRQGSFAGMRRAADTTHLTMERHKTRPPQSFEMTIALDERRKALLELARWASPSTSFRIAKLGNTVLPRVGSCLLTWITFGAYAVAATLIRTGNWDSASQDMDVVESQGMSTLVTFMIVFYVGYCYDRHYQQYLEANKGRNALVDCCAMAGAYMKRQEDADALWAYLNLAHVLAFVGLSPTYTGGNLLDGFVKEHELQISASELNQLRAIGVESGQGAYLQVVQWALLVISAASEREDGTGVHFMKIHSMENEILLFRRSCAALYAYHFQVIPYVYTHMISLVSALYLVTYAVLKGTAFTPDSSLAFGLAFPFLSLLLMTISCIGLIEVGSTLANPWGGEFEDFCVLHFIDSAAVHTRSLVHSSLRGKSARSESAVSPVTPSVVQTTAWASGPSESETGGEPR